MIPDIYPPQQTFKTSNFTYNASKRKRKLVFILAGAIIVIILLLGILGVFLLKGNRQEVVSIKPPDLNVSPTVPPKAINDGQIIISDGESLYLFDTVTMSKSRLPIDGIQKSENISNSNS